MNNITASHSVVPRSTNTMSTSCKTPQSLHREFVRLGSMRLKLKNKMLAILPEIYKTGIYKKYAASIVEYAGKFGDISKTTVIKRLRLEENLEDKPFLKAAVATVGVHKVAMVAKITTPEMDQSMAEKLSNMSKMAVQSLSKELRASQLRDGQNDDCAGQVSERQLSFDDSNLMNQIPDFNGHSCTNPSSHCQAIPLTKKIDLDENSTFLFLKLKKKLGKNLSDKEFLKLILEEREKQEFPQRKGGIDEAAPSGKTTNNTHTESLTGETFSQPRYIPAASKHQALATTNGKCSYPNCNSPCEVFHHADRYSESKSHDSIIPLCKVHHEFAHNNIIENEKRNLDTWKLRMARKTNTTISLADNLYKKYRSEALR